MSALRRAVEVDFKEKDKHKSQGLYLLTTGIPDQETVKSAWSSIQEKLEQMETHPCVMEDADSCGIIPAHYATPTETAIAFKEIVQAANGRFHWFGEAGIFESDDITVIVSEMEKAKNYSQKHCELPFQCAFLVESLKQRSGNQPANPFIAEAGAATVVTKEKRRPQKLPSPKPTALSLARMCFLLGTVYRNYPKTVCIRKRVPSVRLPQKEEICSSKEGVVRHLQVQSKELEIYIEQMEKVLLRYLQRIQWLLSGSRRLFGTILEANVCVLIDTSGSMDPYLPHITKELTSLIWEQLRKNGVRFNLLRFAENIESWREHLVEATDKTCHDAVQWVSKFHAHGNTRILTALQENYLVTI
ncbi:hypothetical protein CIB84_009260 [Bambusicola thoracicus]|uniref:VWFA domain-containing protein n=1 Tax=Bambusicola thoracicus TaxID=9083 RepID=A0A2P4SS98_BAMTH|nr:hypothetical protein CIB84_009260 [Bambusicola thoracicus]